MNHSERASNGNAHEMAVMYRLIYLGWRVTYNVSQGPNIIRPHIPEAKVSWRHGPDFICEHQEGNGAICYVDPKSSHPKHRHNIAIEESSIVTAIELCILFGIEQCFFVGDNFEVANIDLVQDYGEKYENNKNANGSRTPFWLIERSKCYSFDKVFRYFRLERETEHPEWLLQRSATRLQSRNQK